MLPELSRIRGQTSGKSSTYVHTYCNLIGPASAWPFKIWRTCQRLEKDARNGPGISLIDVQYRLKTARAINAPTMANAQRGQPPTDTMKMGTVRDAISNMTNRCAVRAPKVRMRAGGRHKRINIWSRDTRSKRSRPLTGSLQKGTHGGIWCSESAVKSH